MGKKLTLTCYGSNKTDILQIPKIVKESPIQFRLGEMHACAISDYYNQLLCWGSNEFSQSAVPDDFIQSYMVGVGSYHTCALGKSQLFGCWGTEITVEGDNANNLTTPLEAIGYNISLYVGPFNNCTIRHVDKNGDNPSDEFIDHEESSYAEESLMDEKFNYISLYCWGRNLFGQLDLPAPFNHHILSYSFNDIAIGMSHICAISNLQISCWGDDTFKQSSPPMNGGFRLYLWWHTQAGLYHTCSQLLSGALMCWGSNLNGENDDVIPRVAIDWYSSGGNSNCIIFRNDKIHCWGSNAYQQISNVPNVYRY